MLTITKKYYNVMPVSSQVNQPMNFKVPYSNAKGDLIIEAYQRSGVQDDSLVFSVCGFYSSLGLRDPVQVLYDKQTSSPLFQFDIYGNQISYTSTGQMRVGFNLTASTVSIWLLGKADHTAWESIPIDVYFTLLLKSV